MLKRRNVDLVCPDRCVSGTVTLKGRLKTLVVHWGRLSVSAGDAKGVVPGCAARGRDIASSWDEKDEEVVCPYLHL